MEKSSHWGVCQEQLPKDAKLLCRWPGWRWLMCEQSVAHPSSLTIVLASSKHFHGVAEFPSCLIWRKIFGQVWLTSVLGNFR